jgi:signal transduction histidine kinase
LIEIAHKNIRRLLELVDDLLDIQKLDRDRTSVSRERLDARRLIDRALDACREMARQAQVQTTIDDGANGPVNVIGDPDRLHQALVNLLSNAIKFSPRGREVIISIYSDRTHTILAVRDFGPGIPDEFRSRIFGRFAQADTGDARRARGTGLGLSLVKAIAERHDGLVGFDTPLPDGGTRFWLKLPRLPAPSPSPDERAELATGRQPVDAPT